MGCLQARLGGRRRGGEGRRREEEEGEGESFDSACFGQKLSKKMGLSLEKKREQILQIFYDSQDFFLLKELEKLGPKKGVISQSVKDVVQSLVDDDLALKDKIGTSVYFWSRPSCAGNQLRSAYSKLEVDILNGQKRFDELIEQRDNLKKGREESDEREAAVEELKIVEQQHKKLKNWPVMLIMTQLLWKK